MNAGASYKAPNLQFNPPDAKPVLATVIISLDV